MFAVFYSSLCTRPCPFYKPAGLLLDRWELQAKKLPRHPDHWQLYWTAGGACAQSLVLCGVRRGSPVPRSSNQALDQW